MEYIHDELIAKLWSGVDPVSKSTYRNRKLLESAVARPFHSAFGQDIYPTIIEKAGALFHSLIANHPFFDGNKRTAIVAFDHFLVANGFFLFNAMQTLRHLAKDTASYRERGLSNEEALRQIVEFTDDFVSSIPSLKRMCQQEPLLASEYKYILQVRRTVRRNKMNRLIPD